MRCRMRYSADRASPRSTWVKYESSSALTEAISPRDEDKTEGGGGQRVRKCHIPVTPGSVWVLRGEKHWLQLFFSVTALKTYNKRPCFLSVPSKSCRAKRCDYNNNPTIWTHCDCVSRSPYRHCRLLRRWRAAGGCCVAVVRHTACVDEGRVKPVDCGLSAPQPSPCSLWGPGHLTMLLCVDTGTEHDHGLETRTGRIYRPSRL